MKRICFFGIYDPLYSRNRVLRSGFASNGYEVVECRVDPKDENYLIKYWRLYLKYKELNLKNNPCDLVIVAFPGQSVVWLARLLFRHNFILDAFVSLYDSNVKDRALYPSSNPRAWRDYILDLFSVWLSPIILLDTNEHIKFFNKNFYRPLNKFVRVFVGTDSQYFYPKDEAEKRKDDKFIVHFHGHYIPLQGVDFIIGAARLLADDNEIVFRLIGRGQEYSNISLLVRELGLSNVVFIDNVDYDSLVSYLNSADICLGIFGTTAKAFRVIPNKVFEALACGRPIVTMDSPAIRELLNDGKEAVFCRAGDSQDLAEKIKKLKFDLEMRDRIGHNARELYEEKLTPSKIVKQLLEDLEK